MGFRFNVDLQWVGISGLKVQASGFRVQGSGFRFRV
jgi:hypothetical protein